MRRKVARTLCVCALNELTRTSMRALPQTSAPSFIQQRSQKVSQFCGGQDLAGGVDPIWAHYDIAGKRERVNRDLGAPLTMEERCRDIHQEATVNVLPPLTHCALFLWDYIAHIWANSKFTRRLPTRETFFCYRSNPRKSMEEWGRGISPWRGRYCIQIP